MVFRRTKGGCSYQGIVLIGVINLNKILELSYRSIIRILNGDKELSKEYAELALEAHYDANCLHRIEDHVTKQEKRKMYEMVS